MSIRALITRTILLTLLLLLAQVSDFSFIPTTIFLLLSLYFLLKPLQSPFFIISTIAVITLGFLLLAQAENTLLLSFFLTVFAVLYFLLQWARFYTFVQVQVHSVVVGMMLVLFVGRLFESVSAALQGSFHLYAGVIAFLFLSEMFLLWRRAYELSVRRKESMTNALIFAFLLAQLFWVLSLLPIGFLNLAALFGIVFFFLVEVYRNYVKGSLHRTRFLRQASVFVVVLVTILALSSWTI